ncbi:MAG: hypothetical protein Q9227_007856 [Pyrenula ochraceoflavens]
MTVVEASDPRARRTSSPTSRVMARAASLPGNGNRDGPSKGSTVPSDRLSPAASIDKLPHAKDSSHPLQSLGARFDQDQGEHNYLPSSQASSPMSQDTLLINVTEARYNGYVPRSYSCNTTKLGEDLHHFSHRLLSPSGFKESAGEKSDPWSILTPLYLSSPRSYSYRSPPDSQSPRSPLNRRQSIPQVGTASSHSQFDARTRSSPNPAASDIDLCEKWLSLGFMACIHECSGHNPPYYNALSQASQTYLEMVFAQDSQLLLSQIALLSILQCLGKQQRETAAILINAAFSHLERHLPRENPVFIVARWGKIAAAQEVKAYYSENESEYEDLSIACSNLFKSEGPTSPNTLSALYALAFTQNRRGDYKDAESTFETLFAYASGCLSPQHFLPSAALAGRARALTALRDYHSALPIHTLAVERSRLAFGETHPVHLESLRRLATSLLRNIEGQDQKIRDIYWHVYRHRLTQLGPKHPYTKGSYEDLVEFLKERGPKEELAKAEENQPHDDTSWKVVITSSY